MSTKRLSKTRHWHKEHVKNPYVKQANLEGYRSRAVYKLAQIDARDRLFHPGMTIIDLGAAPGSWSQWIARRFEKQVKLLALDILPIEPLPNVTCIQGDFREQIVLDTLLNHLDNKKADLVISDMAPNISGIKAIDQPRIIELAELARDLALDILTTNGHFLTKVFQGEDFDIFIKSLKKHFQKVVIRKPAASRSQSSEVYVLAKLLKE